jgi:hypothetical protein
MRIAQHLILGGTQTKAPLSIAAHIASNAFYFFRVTGKTRLLPLNAADRAWSYPIRMKKGGEHQSQILSFKRSITCPLKRGRSTQDSESELTMTKAYTLQIEGHSTRVRGQATVERHRSPVHWCMGFHL